MDSPRVYISLPLLKVAWRVHLTSILSILFFTTDSPKLSAGLPPYIIQEEFDRYVGFLWQNNSSELKVIMCLFQRVTVCNSPADSDVLYILYEEVSSC